jgi:hypothetical protein
MAMTTDITTATGLSFYRHGDHAAIRHAGREILRFEGYYMRWGVAAWTVLDQCMEAGGGPEVCSLPIFGLLGGLSDPVTSVAYDVCTDGDALVVAITPLTLCSGKAADAVVRECVTFTVWLNGDRYVWTQRLETTFLQYVNLADDAHGLHLYRFHHQDGRPGCFLQYADPAPTNGSGPSVPMTHDWSAQPEPYNGPDSFRQHWTRRYDAIIFQNPNGTFAWSELNKTKWLHLTQDNRRARPCHSRGLLYLVQPDGRALEYRCDAPSHYHHVCEWGMDYHFWCDLEPFAQDMVVPAGTVITAATTVRLVDADVVAPIRTAAVEMVLTPVEHAAANRPAYEEPENHFTVSALERISALSWQPTSDGCLWEYSGGYRTGDGCLIIENRYTDEAAWEVRDLGPQQWANPFIPGKRYRLSAWVQVEQCAVDPSQTAGPQVGIDFVQSNGPGIPSTREVISSGWSSYFFPNMQPLTTRVEWTHIECISIPCPSNVFYARLKLRFIGHGRCRFSSVRWEMLDEKT